jgi:Na+(H+)/acetate symporter ActP
VATAGLLACLTPVGAWTLLVAALGLAASALAPAAVLACWSERATARGAVGGGGAGLVVFLLAIVVGVASPGGLAEGWGSAVAAAPAVIAAPVHFLAAWLLRSRGTPSLRSPLPPGLEGRSVSLPAGPRRG